MEPNFWCLLPPLITILLALLFRQVVIALLTGITLGIFMLHGISLESFFKVIDTYLIETLTDGDHIAVILFTLMIGGMVKIISANGGMSAIVHVLDKKANTKEKAQLTMWLMGILIFFDDYANTLIVGNTMQPLADKHKISRAKLAYIVDSTAAPVAAIFFMTTWIGMELGYLDDANEKLKLGSSAYELFIGSLQYAFYPVLTLFFIFWGIKQGKEFGPMWTSEKKYQLPAERADNYKASNIMLAIGPILTLLLVSIGALIYLGKEGMLGSTSFSDSVTGVMQATDPYKALLWGSFASLAVAIILSVFSKRFSIGQTVDNAIKGMKTIFDALLILVLAWTLSAVINELGVGEYLKSTLGAALPFWLFPLVVFVLAALISFSTGSSWSTMAILYPIVLPLCWAVGTDLPHEESIQLIMHTSAVVLAGSVFGDHCSPISDTTILSSMASGCDHVEHVRTQLPYALTVGAISLLLSLVFVNIGLPWYVNYPLGFGIVVLVFKVLGKKV